MYDTHNAEIQSFNGTRNISYPNVFIAFPLTGKLLSLFTFSEVTKQQLIFH